MRRKGLWRLRHSSARNPDCYRSRNRAVDRTCRACRSQAVQASSCKIRSTVSDQRRGDKYGQSWSLSEIDSRKTLYTATKLRNYGGVNKRFRVCDLNQPFLVPPSLQHWLPEDHLARFVADVTSELDLSAIYAEYERHDARGLSAYHPLLLTRLLLYGYSIGVTSSRAIEKATFDNLAFRYLAADQHPDHDTIASFRQQHLQAFADLFLQVLRLCHRAGLVKLGHVALDGTKMLANASTQRSLSHQKLAEHEQYWKHIVARLLVEAENTDQQEDERFGKGQAGDPLPEELAHAQKRLERIRQAKAELEKEAQQDLEAAGGNAPRKRGRPRKGEHGGQPPLDPRQRDKVKKRRRRAQQNAEQPTRQYNFVDPDSRVMRDNARKCFVQAYNAQIAVDTHQQVMW